MSLYQFLSGVLPFIILAFALFAWIPLTMVVIHKDQAKKNKNLDEKLDELGWKRARGELSPGAHEEEVEKVLATDWEKL